MTPIEALEILYKAAGFAQMPRNDHIVCNNAYELLKKCINNQAKSANTKLEKKNE